MSNALFRSRSLLATRVPLRSICLTGAVCLALLLGSPAAVAGGLFKCFDASGKITYSDSPCAAQDPGQPPKIDRSGKLTKEQVLAMLQAADKAAMRMDFERAADYLAEDAVIDMSIRTPRGTHRATIGKAQYRRLIQDNKGKIWDYAQQRENT